MTTRFVNGQTIDETDFIQTSAGVADEGKAVVTDDEGKIDRTFVDHLIKFGGNGADGALTISSGTTNIDLGGVAVFVKNYTSISITGTGALTFTNPHANGTTIIFKNKGDFVCTSSATWAIDASSLGAAGNTAVIFTVTFTGGRGGGCLYIETLGDWNKTGNIRCNGGNGFVSDTSSGQQVPSKGGGPGMFLGLYNGSLIANTGTLTVTAGADSAFNASGGSSDPTSVAGNDAYGINQVAYGGTGRNTPKTPNTTFAIPNALFSSSYLGKSLMLCPGSAGGAGSFTGSGSPATMPTAGVGMNFALVAENTEFA